MITQVYNIVVGGVGYDLRYSFRSLMLFESASGRSFSGGTLSDELLLMLCQIWASNSSCTMTLDELSEHLDEHPEDLARWREWLRDQIHAQNQRMSGPFGEDESVKPSKSKKKA